jgi:hypothetical protein
VVPAADDPVRLPSPNGHRQTIAYSGLRSRCPYAITRNFTSPINALARTRPLNLTFGIASGPPAVHPQESRRRGPAGATLQTSTTWRIKGSSYLLRIGRELPPPLNVRKLSTCTSNDALCDRHASPSLRRKSLRVAKLLLVRLGAGVAELLLDLLLGLGIEVG